MKRTLIHLAVLVATGAMRAQTCVTLFGRADYRAHGGGSGG